MEKVEKTRKSAGKPRGSPKTGGRTKGTPNRKTALLHELIADAGFDIGHALAETFDKADIDQKIEILKLLLNHFPRAKEIDIPIDSTPPEPITPEQAKTLLKTV